MSRAGSMTAESESGFDQWPRAIEVSWLVPVVAINPAARAAIAADDDGEARVAWRLERLVSGESVARCVLRGADGREVVLARADRVQWTLDAEHGLMHVEIDAVAEPGLASGSERAMLLSVRVDEGNEGYAEVLYARTAALGWLRIAGGRYELDGARFVEASESIRPLAH